MTVDSATPSTVVEFPRGQGIDQLSLRRKRLRTDLRACALLLDDKSSAPLRTAAAHVDPIDLPHSASGFAEVLRLLHRGEQAVMWMPPATGSGEALVYEIELVDIASPPALATRTDTRAATPTGAVR